MYVLGISCHYHDSSACLLKDGVILAAAEEERFTRKKHDNSFPLHAVSYCLLSQKIDINEVDAICYYEKPLKKFDRIMRQFFHEPPDYNVFKNCMLEWLYDQQNLIHPNGTFKGRMWGCYTEWFGKLYIKNIIQKVYNYKNPIYFVEHHQSHGASSFFTSPFEEAAIVTMDGVGEWATTTYGVGKGNKIEILKEIRFPHSLGLLYSTITAYLGFSVNNSEYKVMGLSPYGDMNKNTNPYYCKLKKVIDVKSDGSFRLDMSYFSFLRHDTMPSKKLCRLLGGPVSKRDSEMTKRHKDIAAAVQLVTEETVIALLNHVYTQTKSENLCIAGGVALNSVANGKILSNTPFKNIFIQPASGDGGTSIGAAYFCYNHILGNKKRSVQSSAYLGQQYSNKIIKFYLDLNNIKYSKFDSDEDLINTTARLINDNNVVGWFQGRSEFGPRALGSRSILSNACNPDMQEILNLKVKHREKFRPFAPVVCADDAPLYFDCDMPVPAPTDFMLMVYPIKERYRNLIPAVTHVDGSGRLQTVTHEQNRLYYDVIKEFGKLSGIPILINTSFNIRGEPIVDTPDDAFSCMMGTGIDYLVMGNFLIKRSDNPDYIWDSESLAKD